MREMKDSGIEWIGTIPFDWKCCKQKYEIQLINGRAYSDSEFEEDGKYRILRVGNLFSNPTWYTSSLELPPDKYCENGDLLYSWSMSYAPVIWSGEKVIYHYHIWKTKLSSNLNKKFAYYYLSALTDALKAKIHETTMGFITMGVMNKCYFSVTTPKTSAGCRTIPMLKGVRRALEDEKIRQQELGIKCTTVIDGHTDFVFFNRFGQPHNPAAINREIDRLVLAYNAQEMEQAEEEDRTPVILPDFSCHQLRHTFCTRYCEIEPNIKVIQEVMGHKDIKTTMEIYAEAQKELKERSVQNISGKFDVY